MALCDHLNKGKQLLNKGYDVLGLLSLCPVKNYVPDMAAALNRGDVVYSHHHSYLCKASLPNPIVILPSPPALSPEAMSALPGALQSSLTNPQWRRKVPLHHFLQQSVLDFFFFKGKRH